VGGASWSRRFWTQALEADQHTLQSLKSVFLSRNLDQNKPENTFSFENAFFFEKKKKTAKIAER